MPSPKEVDAAFEAAFKNLPRLIVSLVPDHYFPLVGNLRQMALQKFYDPQTKELARAALTEEVRDVLEAAEEVRRALDARVDGRPRFGQTRPPTDV